MSVTHAFTSAKAQGGDTTLVGPNQWNDVHVIALVDADIPATIARDAEVTSSIATHAAAADPHTDYLRESAGGVIGSGDAQSMYNATTAQLLGILSGTAAAPDTSANPLLKVTRTVAVADANLTGDGVEQLAAIQGIGVGTTALAAQPVGVAGMAKHSGTTLGSGGRSPDACGVYGVGRITGSGSGVGIGAFFVARRENDTAAMTGVEVHVANYGTAAGAWNATGYNGSTGLWITAGGNADGAAAITVGNPFSRRFKVGLGFNAQVSGGLTGGVADSSIRDDSSSTISLDIRGSHTYGLDLQNGTYSVSAIRLPNNKIIVARNAANNGDINILYMNTSNNLVIGEGVTANSVYMAQGFNMADGKSILCGSTSGMKIGTATTQKLGLWNTTPVVQPTAVTDASGGAVIDAEARTALNGLLAKLRTVGLIAA